MADSGARLTEGGTISGAGGGLTSRVLSKKRVLDRTHGPREDRAVQLEREAGASN